jgi:hemerythrin superfamily protein
MLILNFERRIIMEIKIWDSEHTFTYNSDKNETNIIQTKNTKNYCRIWSIHKFINPLNNNMKYILESEENVPMYGDTTIHRMAEFKIENGKLDTDSLYVENSLKVDIVND